MRPATIGLLFVLPALFPASCFSDWDSLDPRLANVGGGGATGATGGSLPTSTNATGGAGGSGGGGSTSSTGGGGAGGAGGMAPLGPWSPPQVVAALSHPADDDDPSTTADGLELFFNSDRGRGDDADIWVSTRASRSDPWSAPTPVIELNTTNLEGNLTVSPDGLTIWFLSDRTVVPSILYISTRPSRNDPWTTPVPADDLNAAGVRDVAGVTWDGLLMVGNLTISNDSQMAQLVRASTAQSWGAAKLLDELNSGANDREGWMHPDGTHVAFGSARTGTQGFEDILASSRSSRTEPFSSPVFVSELSSPQGDTDVTMTEDRRYVLFARSGGQGAAREIFESSR